MVRKTRVQIDRRERAFARFSTVNNASKQASTLHPQPTGQPLEPVRRLAIRQQAEVLEEEVGVPGARRTWGCGLIGMAEGIFRHYPLKDSRHELPEAGSGNGSGGGVLDKMQSETQHNSLATMVE